MYIEQNRRDWIGNELCQWLGWGRAWHLAVESCCGGKRTFNEEPTDHWTTASVHRLQADTARAGTHFCQPLADPTVPSSIETGKIVQQRYAFWYICASLSRSTEVKVPCPGVPSISPISGQYHSTGCRAATAQRGPPPVNASTRGRGKGRKYFCTNKYFLSRTCMTEQMFCIHQL